MGKIVKVVVCAIFILAIIVAIIVFALTKCNNGFGLGGSGDGDGSGSSDGGSSVSDTAEISEEAAETEETAETEAFFNVTVHGSEYVFNSNTYTDTEELLKALQAAGDVTTVRVKDDLASEKAYQALLDALRENDFHYEETETATE